ncbi:hypothetical protein A2954_06265 [Candidatus Roizmanbacteria bacterium RIFCSPLOWO2_01_FULL_37_12]|uniref:Uncharacterized protein n=1 Tax=Candidatus Roizmanbacteria bacterium RIFCSPLOWO2_01_FULL_37_12 TaxID=1802056 RepID=A0A1F7IGX7_9BACT|nr:MAG: hypothetical protein A2954_06265 [Candidatus Roizmanbacteria bacterium RIFCSPLOWO2_01_FULL_37_12]
MLEKFRHWYRILPDKKRYLEFVTALLTIPVLLTVIYTNMVSIREDKKSNTTPTPEKSEKIVIIREDENKENEKSNTPTPIPTLELSPTQSTKECKKEVGPVKISSPSEEEIVQDDLICVKIDYTVGEFCSVAWSYKLDDNKWSDYTSSPFCFSKLDPGKHELDLRVQSVASSDEVTLERTFYIKTKEAPSPTPTPLP